AEALTRRRRPGLRPQPDRRIERGYRERDVNLGAPRSLLQHVDVADDHRTTRDDAERVARRRQDLDALPRQPVVAFSGLIGIGGGTDRDALTAPRATRQLLAQDVGHVRLHAHGLPIFFARRTVGPPLVPADVAVRAAVH